MKSLSIFFLFALTVYPQLKNGKLIDLSYAYDENTIYWPTAEGFKLTEDFRGYTEGNYFYSSNTFSTSEHGGTHLDAPYHFYEEGSTTDKIPLDKLIGNGILIDVSEKCLADRDYLISVDDFLEWEKENGKIEENVIVILKTGYGRYWPDREKYLGTDKRGVEGVAELHFPGLDPEAAKWLAERRKIKAVGIETASIDFGQSETFQSHIIFGSHNIPIFENVANTDQLPVKDFLIIALPIKIKNGSGGPLRLIAIVNY